MARYFTASARPLEASVFKRLWPLEAQCYQSYILIPSKYLHFLLQIGPLHKLEGLFNFLFLATRLIRYREGNRS